ncbi:aspartate dehydrogenase domain-containing protein [Candidatus Omnitrophota bacterium]
MKKKILAIIGCGTIGEALAVHAGKNLTSHIEKIILCDIDQDKTSKLAGKIQGADITADLNEAIEKADIVVEAVSPKVALEVLELATKNKKDVMIMSIGGLLGNEKMLSEASDSGIKVMLPSGAIAGIDAVKAAKTAGIESVTLTTRKSPKSIKGAPYLEANGIDVDKLDKETVIFEGNALEAMKAFPKNINVSALLSIAGIGGEKTNVSIVVSPEYTKNTHEIEVKSAAGVITARTANVPSPSNPKTSYLAALAAIASLEGYFNTVRIGT